MTKKKNNGSEFIKQKTTFLRGVRSYARKAGRITPAQRAALENHWDEYGIEMGTEPVDIAALFQREAPTFLDIGFGMGDALVAMAAAHPEWNFIGVEVYRAGVGKCLQEVVQQDLHNVRIFNEDAVTVLAQAIPPNSIQGVFLWFPDPWPKKRHHKRRIVQIPFAQQIAQCLVPQGYWHIATDWLPYGEHVKAILSQCPEFVDISQTEEGMAYSARRLSTKYERRGERLGHSIWDGIYQVIKQNH